MDFVKMLALVWPEGNFWASLIRLFDVNSYVWTILIFTIVLKLLISPLDFFQRFYTNKNARVQALIQPEMEKLKKHYGQNQMLLQKKQTELYSKYNFSMKGSCIVMLIYMVVTLVVFLTLFRSLQTISSFKIKNQFEDLQTTYNTSYDADFSDYVASLDGIVEEYNLKETDEEKLEYLITLYATKNSATEDDATVAVNSDLNSFIDVAQNKVVVRYEEIKDSWLWVKNIWRPDKPTQTAILNHADYVSATGSKVSQKEYNVVMAKLLNNKEINAVNGYYILSIIVVLVSLLSQYLSRKLSQPKGVQAQQGGLAKVLMFILPLAMLMFTLNSSAMFSVYIITNSLISTILIPITTKISNSIENRKEKERKDKNKAIYSR